MTSLLRQNDFATSFWRNNGVIIASYARWEVNIQSGNELLPLGDKLIDPLLTQISVVNRPQWVNDMQPIHVTLSFCP